MFFNKCLYFFTFVYVAIIQNYHQLFSRITFVKLVQKHNRLMAIPSISLFPVKSTGVQIKRSK